MCNIIHLSTFPLAMHHKGKTRQVLRIGPHIITPACMRIYRYTARLVITLPYTYIYACMPVYVYLYEVPWGCMYTRTLKCKYQFTCLQVRSFAPVLDMACVHRQSSEADHEHNNISLLFFDFEPTLTRSQKEKMERPI